MGARFIIAGTDTNVGKTVFAAALTAAIQGIYFKPIQAGLEGETDTETVQRLTGLPDAHFLPEFYRLRKPASPHIAAENDNVTIDVDRLVLPATDRPLVVEGAGGVMVPLTKQILQIDVFARWNAPVILCARTGLGTINHSLLSIEALKTHSIPIHGIVFLGEANPQVTNTISQMGDVACLGHLPRLAILNSVTLAEAFKAHFRLQDFQ